MRNIHNVKLELDTNDTHHSRIVSWCQKCWIDHLFIAKVVNKFADDKLDFNSSGLIPRLQRISLCHSGLKGIAVPSVRGIVTFNDFKSYCLDSSTLTFLTHSVLPSFLKGGKYMENTRQFMK